MICPTCHAAVEERHKNTHRDWHKKLREDILAEAKKRSDQAVRDALRRARR